MESLKCSYITKRGRCKKNHLKDESYCKVHLSLEKNFCQFVKKRGKYKGEVCGINFCKKHYDTKDIGTQTDEDIRVEINVIEKIEIPKKIAKVVDVESVVESAVESVVQVSCKGKIEIVDNEDDETDDETKIPVYKPKLKVVQHAPPKNLLLSDVEEEDEDEDPDDEEEYDTTLCRYIYSKGSKKGQMCMIKNCKKH